MITVKKFSASWCHPCRSLNPILAEVRNEVSGVSFSDIDVDDNPTTASHYNVRNVPTVVIESEGREVARFVGVHSKQTYLNAITANSK